MGEIAALISAVAAVIGLLLGFYGLPAVVDSPTAQAGATATVTTTVTAPAQPGAGDTGRTQPPSPLAPLPSGVVPLSDLTPVAGDYAFTLRSVTLRGTSYENAMVLTDPCSGSPIEFSVNERYRRLTLTAGLDDNGIAELVKITIKGDGQVLKTVGAEINRPQAVTVEVTGVVKLTITSEGGCASSERLVVALADAELRT